MSEPPRLLDQTDDEFVAGLLRAAQKQAPRRSSVNKTLLALGTSASLLGGHATAGASALAGPLVKLALKWTLLGGVALGTAVSVVELGPSAATHASGTALTARTSVGTPATPKGKSLPARPVQPAQAAPLEQAAAVDTPAAPANAAPEDSPRPLLTDESAVPERRDAAASPRRPSAAVAERTGGTPQPLAEQLEQEVALLDRAAQALNANEFEQAAALADQYLTRFVSGRLEPEARYLKMQAQRGMGDRSGASDEARRLLQLSPDGPHARTAREIQSE